MRRIVIGGLILLALARAGAEDWPDLRSVPADLTVPEMSTANVDPAAGQRVRATTPGWEKTDVYHALYLPTDWTPERRFPVIAEWAGNGPYQNEFGDISTGRVEGSQLGFGLAGGSRCIWVCLPYLNNAGTANVIKWWGDAPGYDPEPTLAYCRATIRDICARFGGDSTRVILAGFSRGAIACNYLGLHDAETASLWRGLMAFSHYDGVRTTWPYPGADRAAAWSRLQRLQGRPQFICGENDSVTETRRYLEASGALPLGQFTFAFTGFRNHNDAWILRPSPARDELRRWFADILR